MYHICVRLGEHILCTRNILADDFEKGLLSDFVISQMISRKNLLNDFLYECADFFRNHIFNCIRR